MPADSIPEFQTEGLGAAVRRASAGRIRRAAEIGTIHPASRPSAPTECQRRLARRAPLVYWLLQLLAGPRRRREAAAFAPGIQYRASRPDRASDYGARP